MSGFLVTPPSFIHTPTPVLIQQNLDAVRNKVEALYRDYIELRGDTSDYVDHDRLEGQVSRLRDLTLHLVVAGEVKSGKSSFVNALLGAPLLPVDTLQMSSAVVEVAHGDRRHLEVTYASGDIEEITDGPDSDWADKARATLDRVAAVPGDYRDLPIVHLRQIATTPLGSPTNALIRALAADPATNQEGLSPDQFLERSRAFISEHGAPSQVATRIRLTHPLPHGSTLVKVVDTPGVNAVGGIESVTRDYLRRADALLFVQSLATPTASHSFRTFVEDNVTDKIKEALFLILTHASTLGKTNRQKRIDDARRNYGAVVGSEDRIMAVDNVMQAIRSDMEDEDNVDSLFDRYDAIVDGSTSKHEVADAQEKNRLLADLARRQSDFAILKDMVEDAAGFGNVHHTLAAFAGRAPYIQIAAVLDTLAVGLDNLAASHAEQRVLNEQGAQDPQVLKADLERRREEIDRLRDKLRSEQSAIADDFAHKSDGIIAHDLSAKKKEWIERLNACNSKEALQTSAESATEDAERLFDDWRYQLLRRCQSVLRNYDRSVDLPEGFAVPVLDVEAIAERLRADHTEPDEKGTLFWKETVDKLNEESFLRALRQHLIGEVRSRGEAYAERFKGTIPKVIGQYRRALDEVLDQKTAEYREIEGAHRTAQEFADRAAFHARTAAEASDLRERVVDLRTNVPA